MKNRILSWVLLAVLCLTLAPLSALATDAELPAYSEITVEVFDRGNVGGTDPTNNYYTDWIKAKVLEELNIGVTFVAVSRGEENVQLNNLMAAGTAPDICFTYSGDLITNYANQGGIVDLTPYIEAGLLTNLTAFLGPDLAKPGSDFIYRNKNVESGATWSVPARRLNNASCNTFIRKDWLDALGLAIPTTTEEFVNVLREFKEKDPGGVGADKIVPFTMTRDVRWRASTLIESFIDPSLTDKDRWINTVADRRFLLPGYKEGVRLVNQLYNEGLIDPEFPLYVDDTGSDNLIKSGVVGAFIHNWDQPYRATPGLLNDLLVNVPGAEIVAINPFQDAAGNTPKSLYDAAGVQFFVPVFSQNPEGAVRYADWLSKFENRYYLQTGDEGVTHVMDNGVPRLITVEGEKIMNSGQNIDYTFMINGLDTGDNATYMQALAGSYAVDAQLIVDAFTYAMQDGRPPVIVPGVEIVSAGPVNETLVQKGETLLAQAITAKPEDFDAVWDEGIADWLASGAQEVIDERAAKYVAP